MKSYLLFGDSHVGSIFHAYKTSFPRPNFTFLPAPGPIVNCMSFTGHNLVLSPPPPEWPQITGLTSAIFQKWYADQENRFLQISGGREISLSQFDGIIIYGGRTLPLNIKWWDFVKNLEGFSASLGADLLSSYIKHSFGFRWLESLTSYAKSTGEVFVVLNPYLNEAAFTEGDGDMIDLKVFRQMPSNFDIFTLFKYYRLLFSNMGFNYIDHPIDIYNDSRCAIKREYKQPSFSDFHHLNAEGSKIMLNSIMRKVYE